MRLARSSSDLDVESAVESSYVDIGAILNLDVTPVDALDRRLAAMNRLLAHRGPDGEGVWMHPRGHVGFAHRRLDEAAAEHARERFDPRRNARAVEAVYDDLLGITPKPRPVTTPERALVG